MLSKQSRLAFYAVGAILIAAFSVLGFRPSLASGPSTNMALNYQARITDSSGVILPDGAKNIKFVIYDAVTGGNCEYTARGTCGTPTEKSVTIASGTFSSLIGGSGDVAMASSLFSGDEERYLEISVETSTPGTYEALSPRKRIVSSAFAFNANLLDDLDTSNAGGSTAFVPVTDSSGNFTLTKDVTFDTDTFVVDSTNDRVGIGQTSPSNMLTVGDDLTVQGGLNSSHSSSARLAASETFVSGSAITSVSQAISAPTASTSGSIQASGSFAQIASGNTQNHTGGLAGAISYADHLGTGTLSTAYGIGSFSTANSSSTITDAYGLYGGVVVNDTATVTNAYGVYGFLNMNGTTTTITAGHTLFADNVYEFATSETLTGASGLTVVNQTAATNNVNALLGTSTIPSGNFSLYSASAYDSYFAGNVGIGTASPSSSYAMTILESSGVDGLLIRETTSNTAAVIAMENTARTWRIQSDSDLDELRFGQTTGGPTSINLVIKSSGNVGVGDDSPDNLLELLSTTAANTQLTITNTNAGDYDSVLAFELTDSTPTFTMGVDDSDSDKFKIGTTAVGTNTRLTIDSSGNVGIGDTSPAALLTVGDGDDFQVDTTGDISTTGTLDVSGATTLDGAVTLGDATDDDITFTGYLASSIIPKTDDTYDLGSATKRFTNLYLGGETLHLGASATDEGLISYTSNTLTFGTASNADIVSLPNGTGITIIGDAGSTSNTLNANDDLFVSGELEVDGNAFFDEDVTIFINKIITSDTSNGTTFIPRRSTQTPDTGMLTVGSLSNHFLVTEYGDRGFDFAHAQQTNPTIFVHSANQSATEWLSLSHDQTDGVITSGAGALKLSSASGNINIPGLTASQVVLTDGSKNLTTAATLAHEYGGIEADISAITTGGLLRGTASGTMGVLTIGSDGQVLTAQADGTAAWENAASGGMAIGDSVTSGTTGSLLFVGSGPVLAQDNANIFWDDTNNRLGIGDTSPDDLLNIHSASAEATLALTSLGTNTDAAIKFELADGTATFMMGVDDSDLDKFKIGTSALATNTRLTIDSSGNVGIGETSPSALLHLDTSINSRALKLYDDGTSAWATEIVVGEYRSVLEQDTPTVAFVWGTRSKAGAAASSITEHMRIDDNGNVGIGTTSPNYALDVTDSTGTAIRFGNAAEDNGGFLISVNNGQAVLAGGQYFNGSNWVARHTTSQMVNTDLGVIQFTLDSGLTIGNTFTPTEIARLTSTGLGIGDTSPDDLLNIHSASAEAALALTSLGTNTDAVIKFELADGTSTFAMGVDDSDLDKFKIGTTAIGTNTRLTIDSSGNVGIGDTTPDALLDVAFSSTSTTAASELGLVFDITDTGIVTTGTDTTTGLDLNLTRTGATGGTITSRGIDLDVTGDAGGTSTAYGLDIYVTGADNVTGTFIDIDSASDTGEASGEWYDIDVTGDTDVSGQFHDIYQTGNGVISGVGMQLESDGTGDMWGLEMDVNNSQTSVDSGDTWGIYMDVDGDQVGSSSVYGIEMFVNNLGGTPSSTLYGLKASVPGSASSGTSYGIYISDEESNYLSGDVGIGETTPSEELHISAANATIRLDDDGTDYANLSIETDGDFKITLNSGTQAGSGVAEYDGDANWDFVSDERLKTGIEDAESFLEKVMNLKVRRYNYIEGDIRNYKEIGLIAQEVEPYFPELVGTNLDPRFEDGLKTLGYTTFGVIALKAAQEIASVIDMDQAPIDYPSVYISSSGNVGVGDTNPSYKLDIHENLDGVVMSVQDSDGTCTLNPEASGSWSCTSDARLKENIRDAEAVLPRLMQAQIRDFEMIASGETKTGVVAQEFVELFPGMVHATKGSEYYVVDNFSSWELVKAIQELNAMVEIIQGGDPDNISGDEISPELSNTVLENNLDVAGYALINVGSISGLDGLWSIDGSGNMIAQSLSGEEITTKEVKVKITDEIKTIGTAHIPVSETSVTVQNEAVADDSRVFVTFRKNPKSAWWIEAIFEGGFVIVTDNPVEDDVTFDYWIVNIIDETTPVEESEEEEPPVEEEEPPVEEEPAEEEPPVEEPPADDFQDSSTVVTQEVPAEEEPPVEEEPSVEEEQTS